MTPQPTTSAATLATGRADRPTALDRLLELATTVLNKHVNDNGWCAACAGVAFPCDLAVLAEHNTALL
jgi:hypothetical protein